MKKLIIKKSGLFIEFPGISVRTPAEINITNINMNFVISKLRSLGCDDYDIVTEEDKPIVSKKIEVKKEEPIVDNSNIENLLKSFLQQTGERFDRIETIIKNLQISSPQEVTQKLVTKKDIEDSFVPKIDTSGMKIKGNVSKTSTSRDDLNDQVSALNKIKSGGGFSK